MAHLVQASLSFRNIANKIDAVSQLKLLAVLYGAIVFLAQHSSLRMISGYVGENHVKGGKTSNLGKNMKTF